MTNEIKWMLLGIDGVITNWSNKNNNKEEEETAFMI